MKAIGAHWATKRELASGRNSKVGTDGYPYELKIGMVQDGWEIENGRRVKAYTTRSKWYLARGTRFHRILNAEAAR